MNRRTKIVSTLGPSTDSPAVLRALIDAGVDVVRVNFSHGQAEDHARRIRAVREVAEALGRDVGVLADLQGPKIRIERFRDGPIELADGARFALDTAHPADAGDESVVGCSYPALPDDVSVGDTLLLNDGLISLRVDAIAGTRIDCTVINGGRLGDRKGINKLGGGLSAAALTDKDRADLRTAVELGVEFIAVSFPRSAADMDEARRLVHEAGGEVDLVAKIERAEALQDLESLIMASEAVMVARGDLGVEIGDAELPGWQKRIIPTRAEVLDVANAVMDGTDAVMLSAETAVGKHPVRVVQTMARVCAGAEASAPANRSPAQFDSHFQKIDEAIAMATTWTARHMRAQAILALTESGATALMMSRNLARIPIFAMTRHVRTRRRMALCRGVFPVAFEPEMLDTPKPVAEAVRRLVGLGLLQPGDRVLVTKGDFTGPGGTNSMKIVTVEDAP